jgi:hypothetical protein
MHAPQLRVGDPARCHDFRWRIGTNIDLLDATVQTRRHWWNGRIVRDRTRAARSRPEKAPVDRRRTTRENRVVLTQQPCGLEWHQH